MYLTDEQHLMFLKKQRERLNHIDKATGIDSTTIGDKYTTTNVGMCDDSLTTKETALFPDEFPQRMSSKYTEKYHKCPLDKRKLSELGMNGCFHTCRFFKDGLRSITRIKLLYDELIKEVQEGGQNVPANND